MNLGKNPASSTRQAAEAELARLKARAPRWWEPYMTIVPLLALFCGMLCVEGFGGGTLMTGLLLMINMALGAHFRFRSRRRRNLPFLPLAAHNVLTKACMFCHYIPV